MVGSISLRPWMTGEGFRLLVDGRMVTKMATSRYLIETLHSKVLCFAVIRISDKN